MTSSIARRKINWQRFSLWAYKPATSGKISDVDYNEVRTMNRRTTTKMRLSVLSHRWAQCTAGNWTKLNCSVQFPAVHWTGDDVRRFGDEIGGRRRFFATGTHLWIDQSTQRLSLDENRRRAAMTTTAVAGSMHSEKLNWTQLNWSSSVQFSFQSF